MKHLKKIFEDKASDRITKMLADLDDILIEISDEGLSRYGSSSYKGADDYSFLFYTKIKNKNERPIKITEDIKDVIFRVGYWAKISRLEFTLYACLNDIDNNKVIYILDTKDLDKFSEDLSSQESLNHFVFRIHDPNFKFRHFGRFVDLDYSLPWYDSNDKVGMRKYNPNKNFD